MVVVNVAIVNFEGGQSSVYQLEASLTIRLTKVWYLKGTLFNTGGLDVHAIVLDLYKADFASGN